MNSLSSKLIDCQRVKTRACIRGKEIHHLNTFSYGGFRGLSLRLLKNTKETKAVIRDYTDLSNIFNQYLTPEEFAEIFGMKVRTVRSQCASGVIPNVKLGKIIITPKQSLH